MASTKELKRQARRARRLNSQSWCLVYGLSEAPGMPIKYIGQTRSDPELRRRWHMKLAMQRVHRGERMSAVEGWVHSLIEAGKEPHIEVLDRNGVWDLSEAAWIERSIAGGARLLNVASVVADRISHNEIEINSYRRTSTKLQFGHVLWED